MFGFLYFFFGSLLLAGLILLVADAYWYLRFRAAAAELTRYSGGFVISKCLVCGGQLLLNEQRSTRLGIPDVARTVLCATCRSILEQSGPARWRWRVDEAANAELAWLYHNELLSDDDLRGIAVGQHTTHARARIAEREEQRRRAARSAALSTIAQGYVETLAELEDRLIEAPPGVSVMRGDQVPTQLALQKNERCLLVMKPVSLAETRTRNNVLYVKTVDDGGEFVVTDRRYGFVGPAKSVQQKLGVIERIQQDGQTLVVGRSNRKWPEHFIGLDAHLAEAVLRGVTRQG